MRKPQYQRSQLVKGTVMSKRWKDIGSVTDMLQFLNNTDTTIHKKHQWGHHQHWEHAAAIHPRDGRWPTLNCILSQTSYLWTRRSTPMGWTLLDSWLRWMFRHWYKDGHLCHQIWMMKANLCVQVVKHLFIGNNSFNMTDLTCLDNNWLHDMLLYYHYHSWIVIAT